MPPPGFDRVLDVVPCRADLGACEQGGGRAAVVDGPVAGYEQALHDEMQGDVDRMHASEGGAGGSRGSFSPWAGLNVGVKSDDIRTDDDAATRPGPEGEGAGEGAGQGAWEGAGGGAGERRRGGGQRLTALMPCKRELDATNPGAAFLREAGFEVRPLHNYLRIRVRVRAPAAQLTLTLTLTLRYARCTTTRPFSPPTRRGSAACSRRMMTS